MRIDHKQASGAVKPSEMFQQIAHYREKAANCRAHARAQPNDDPAKHLLMAEKYERRANVLELRMGAKGR
jgi:hypothetical protein